MSLKPCVDCGRYVTTDVRACPYCGRRVTNPVEMLWDLGVLIMALCAIGGVAYFATNSLELHKLVDSLIGTLASIL
jgi:hypothetical protein